MSARSVLAALIAAVALGGCDGASNDPGLEAWLRVTGAQYVPGALPEPNGGPEVASLVVPHTTIRIGTRSERVSGGLEPEANAVAIMRSGDAGYWIVNAATPSIEEPDLPTFASTLELSRETPEGDFVLLASAVDRQGRFGPRERLELSATHHAIDAELLITLRWDTHADLDLHVIDPNGTELWARNINTYEPPRPGKPPDAPDAWQSGGMLDLDSNASCMIDGRCEENAYWIVDPPTGMYRVRVATSSLCGQDAARWSVEARLDGKLRGRAEGLSLPSDTRDKASQGGGIDALELEVR